MSDDDNDEVGNEPKNKRRSLEKLQVLSPPPNNSVDSFSYHNRVQSSISNLNNKGKLNSNTNTSSTSTSTTTSNSKINSTPTLKTNLDNDVPMSNLKPSSFKGGNLSQTPLTPIMKMATLKKDTSSKPDTPRFTLNNFDQTNIQIEITPTEKLTHPTLSRPKPNNRRTPTKRFNFLLILFQFIYFIYLFIFG